MKKLVIGISKYVNEELGLRLARKNTEQKRDEYTTLPISTVLTAIAPADSSSSSSPELHSGQPKLLLFLLARHAS